MAEQLPVDVWTLILRHVPHTDRLGSCSLVSQKLRNAAAAATDALELAFTPGQELRAEDFQGYLQQHGSHLTTLKLQHRLEQLLAQLPCSRLLCLELRSGAVQLGPRNGLPGVLASCTGLTRLELSDCWVSSGLSGLSVLVDLRDLELFDLLPSGGQLSARLPGSVLPCMQHLTCLQLSRVVVEEVHHVSCLSSLAVLSINCRRPLRLAPDIAPGFVLPASLHDLSLTGSGVQLDPAVLPAALQLTRLELRWLTLVGQGHMSSGAALLAAVAGLHKLATLELHHVTSVWPRPSAAYQALTASSRLQNLAALDCRLPADAWEHVFPPAAVCGELQRLQSTDEMGVGAVSALVRCCPRLQHLNVTVRSAPAVAALKSLTCLTSLALYPRGFGEADVPDCVQGVAALTNLRSLCLLLYEHGFGFQRISRAEMLPLAALTQLTYFHFIDKLLTNQAGLGQPPDVWQQLELYCLEDESDMDDGADDTDDTDSDD